MALSRSSLLIVGCRELLLARQWPIDGRQAYDGSMRCRRHQMPADWVAAPQR